MLRSSPFKKSNPSVATLMLHVIWASSLGAIALFWFFGWGVLFNLITCTLVAVIAEACILKIRQRNVIRHLRDYSAVVTAVLLGLALPPLAPWWIAAIGSVFAIVFAKHLFGGLGYNPFNPAMAAYVLLLISFPVAMTGWLPPQSLAQHSASFTDSLSLFLFSVDTHHQPLAFYRTAADGFTMATPLDELKTGFKMGFISSELLVKPIFNDWIQVGWQWVNFCFLLGGIYLLIRKVIHWHIPVSLLGSMFILSSLLYGFDNQQFISPLMHFMSGATMLGAFFIATDPVSAATTPKGRILFGAGIGILTVVIRSFGGYPDAIAFAVLLMNMSAPLIDHYTQPTVYGARQSLE